MASEITVTADLAYSDSAGAAAELFVEGLVQDVTTKVFSHAKQSILTTETVINLGGVASVGWVLLKNLDPTNYVDVKTAASGVVFARLKPAGGVCLLFLGSGVTAPVAVANVAACVIDKLICSQ